MTLVLALVVLSAVITVAAIRVLGPDPFSASAIAIALLATDFVARPLELVSRLDSPFPQVVFGADGLGSERFGKQDFEAAMVKAQLLYLLWIPLFVMGSLAVRRLPARSTREPIRLLPADSAVSKMLPVLGGIALVTTSVVWAKYGVSDLARVAKRGEVAVPSFLRSPSILLAYLGMALAVYGRREGSRRDIFIGISGFVVGAAFAFTWGARDAAVLPVVMVVAALAARIAAVPTRVEKARLLLIGCLLGLVVLGSGLGLRYGRELVAFGETVGRTTEGSIVRRLAVTTNHTRYDAVLLLFDDTNPTPEQAGLGVFPDAFVQAALMRQTEGSDLSIPATQVRRSVEPNASSGWPITAVGDWFFAGRWAGLVIGAVGSGVIFGLVDRWRATHMERSWICATAIVAAFATTITWGGIGVTMPARLRSLMVIGVLVLVLWEFLHQRKLAKGALAP